MSKCSMAEALNKASVYIDRRVLDGSKPSITLPHAEHILIVALSAAVVAHQICKDDEFVSRAFICGLLHDIGRYIVDEKASKYPHTIAGYERCMKLKISFVAPICLTHAILDYASHQEYPDYTDVQLDWVNEKMSHITRSFYDDLVMLIDLHCRGDQVMKIQDRLAKNQQFYHIESPDYCKKYMDLDARFKEKYNVDVYNACRFVYANKKAMFKQLAPYCHGLLRYVCGDTSVANQYPPQVRQQLLSYSR